MAGEMISTERVARGNWKHELSSTSRTDCATHSR